jgi:RNA polymerase sigma-70 factor (ECF subfamily)
MNATQRPIWSEEAMDGAAFGALPAARAAAPPPLFLSQPMSAAVELNDQSAIAPAVLIAAIAERRCRASFAALFNHFAPKLKSYLIKQGCRPEQAEELAQEALLAVWRKADYFDPGKAGASTWIFTIARNLRIDALRRERRPDDLIDDPLFQPQESPSAESALATAQGELRLREALKTLPADQAQVVRMSFFSDKPHSEISLQLGVPLGTVKSRLRLAMARLRAALEDRP